MSVALSQGLKERQLQTKKSHMYCHTLLCLLRIRLIESIEMTTYFIWIWQDTTGEVVEAVYLSEIANPSFYCLRKVLYNLSGQAENGSTPNLLPVSTNPNKTASDYSAKLFHRLAILKYMSMLRQQYIFTMIIIIDIDIQCKTCLGRINTKILFWFVVSGRGVEEL